MNSSARSTPKSLKLVLITAFGLVIFSLFTILIHAASTRSVLGADFYTFWMAGRAAFIDQVSPYSQTVTEQIQMGKLGRLANPGEDQMAYAYPPYGLIPVLPTIFLPFDWASAIWLALNVTVLTALIFFQPVRVRSFLLSVFLFFPFFLNLVLGTFDILAVAGILIFFGIILAQKRNALPIQILAGILLAWATMKPQLVWLVIGFSLVVAVREKYSIMLKSFLASLVVFVLLSFLLVPDWITSWIRQVLAYAGYVQSHPTIAEFFMVFFPAKTSLYLSGIAFIVFSAVAIILLARWWTGRLHWLKPLAWLAMMTYMFHLHAIAYEQIIFLLPMIVWINLRGKWFSKEVLFFWTTALVISWVSFALGINNSTIDRSPVLFNLVWVGWLLRKSGFQL